MAEADKVQAIEMAPALAVEKMIESGLTPEMVVQYKTGIAQASAQMFEHIHLGLFMVTRIPLVTSWLKLLRT